jgi:hypothetical protein
MVFLAGRVGYPSDPAANRPHCAYPRKHRRPAQFCPPIATLPSRPAIRQRQCSASGSVVMYSAASRRVIRAMPLGSGMGSSNARDQSVPRGIVIVAKAGWQPRRVIRVTDYIRGRACRHHQHHHTGTRAGLPKAARDGLRKPNGYR